MILFYHIQPIMSTGDVNKVYYLFGFIYCQLYSMVSVYI